MLVDDGSSLINSWECVLARGVARALTEWSEFCANGVTEIWLKPNYACYDPGDRATLTLQLQTLHARSRVANWASSRS